MFGINSGIGLECMMLNLKKSRIVQRRPTLSWKKENLASPEYHEPVL